ncbi:YhjD/YihY/BrkB family envelope integrity protein [uncultured Sphingomonas sp.]|uniref:YhjD/YihY/BrkB family envelope integrity protein n=1 Tax=uncultured Sphingomonas sp. TaxID=158754 RepID=UPI0035CABEE5
MNDQGHDATSPWRMPLAGWIAVAKRTWAETSADNVGLIAAGVAFYGFLAIVPLLGAMVLVYGIVADPQTVMRDMMQLTSVMPADAAKLVGEQLMNVVRTSDGKKGFGLLLALALALFGARNGAGAVITALNIAYEEKESRGFLRVNLLALAMTATAVIVAIIALIAIAALGHLESLLPAAPGFVIVAGKVAAYVLLLLAGAGAAATLYRYGPARRRAEWVWLTPGSLLAALLWLALTIGFGIYVANFGNYNATYGSLGAVVVTLTWLYLSSYILIFGAELNSELEHQTAQDTTRGDAPVGERGAWVADHVASDDTARRQPADEKPTSTSTGTRAAFATSRAGSNAAHLVGLPKVGWSGSLAATLGLSLLRRGSAGPGAALLGGAAALAWIGRKRTPPIDKRIKAVLFDVDGTLVDSNEFHVEAWVTAFAERNLSFDPDTVRGQIGKGGDLLVPSLVPGATDGLIKALSKRHGEIFKQRYIDRVQPFSAAAALIQAVHDRGQKPVLASSADGKEVSHYAKLLDIRSILAATTSSDDVRTSKPAGDIFAAALKKVAPLKPDEVIVIGDTPYDVTAAAKCGIAAIAVRSGGFSDAVLRRAGAVALYDDVAALLADYDASPLGQ